MTIVSDDINGIRSIAIVSYNTISSSWRRTLRSNRKEKCSVHVFTTYVAIRYVSWWLAANGHGWPRAIIWYFQEISFFKTTKINTLILFNMIVNIGKILKWTWIYYILPIIYWYNAFVYINFYDCFLKI